MHQFFLLLFIIIIFPFLFFLFLKKPKIVTALTIFFSLVQLSWFSRFMGLPSYFNKVTLLLIFIAGLIFLLHFSLNDIKFNTKICFLKPVVYLGLFLVCFTFFTNFYNEESILFGLFELRFNLSIIVFALAIWAYFKDNLNISLFKKMIVYVGLVQIPFIIIQNILIRYRLIYVVNLEESYMDAFTGTFGGYPELIACQLIAIGIVLNDKLAYNKNLLKMNSYITSVLLVVPLVLSGSRLAMGFVLIMLIFCFIYASIQKRNIVFWVIRTSQISILTVLILFLFFSFFWQQYNIYKQLNPSFVYEYFTREPAKSPSICAVTDPRMGRLRALIVSFSMVTKNPVNALIGYGSGSVSESSSLNKSGNLYQSCGPLAGLGRIQYSKTITEFGFIGLFVFIMFFYVIFNTIKCLPQKKDYISCYSIILITLLLLSAYGYVLDYFYISFIIGFFLATAQKEYDQTH